MKMMLIAGHGGTPYDPGACGCSYKEAVLTRELVALVKTELEAYAGLEVAVFDTGKDAYKHLKGGGALPLAGVSYVLEIHFNACVNDETGDGRTTGTEILVRSDEAGVGVEQAIVDNIAALGLKNRGVKRNDGLLVMNTVKRAGVSHALLETCFIDDRDDMTVYQANKKAVAAAIARGVATGFKLEKKAGENDIDYEKFKQFMARYERERDQMPPSKYAGEAWDALQKAGVSDGSAPRSPMTREQYAVMEQRAGRIGKCNNRVDSLKDL